MYVTVNETIQELLSRFDPIREIETKKWSDRCRSPERKPGQKHEPGIRVSKFSIGSTGDVVKIASNKGNFALVARMQNGKTYDIPDTEPVVTIPLYDPWGLFRSNEDEVDDLYLALQAAVAKEVEDDFGNEPRVTEEDVTDDF